MTRSWLTAGVLAAMLLTVAVADEQAAADALASATARGGSAAGDKKVPRSEAPKGVRSNGNPAPQELFKQSPASKAFDLAFTELRFAPGSAQPCVLQRSEFPYAATGGQQLSLYDDDSVEVAFTGGFRFPFFGQSYSSVFVGSNGYVTFDSPDISNKFAARPFNAFPRVAALMTDLFPSSSTTVTASQIGTQAFVVTVLNMEHYLDLDSRISYQIALLADGTASITHLGTNLVSRKIKALVGLASGLQGDKKNVNLGNGDTCSDGGDDASDTPSPSTAPNPSPCIRRGAPATQQAYSSSTASSDKPSSALPPVTVTSSKGIPSEGRDLFRPQIINGSPAPSGRYPFMVFLNGCGGSLVAPNVVLCAAHCQGVSSRVWIGGNDLNRDNFEVIQVKREFVHPDYDKRTSDNDFMLIELEESSSYSPILMDSAGTADSVDLPIGSDTGAPVLTVAGWGSTREGGSLTSTLMQVDVNYIDNPACAAMYPNEDITSSMMCAAAPGKDSCQGDSGGPIFVTRDRNGISEDVQVGVVSWGYGCAQPNEPGVYARISNVRTWIDNVMTNTIGSPPLQPCSA